MATPSESQAVRSLNYSGGCRRFRFKRFSQRVEEIEIDVYRSLNAKSSEPSHGSFFLDSLMELRIAASSNLCTHKGEMACLVALKELIIEDSPDLSRSCTREIGEDWHKICSHS